MFLLFGAFIAGVITVVAPCVLPLLPVIIGGSVGGKTADKRRPLIIAASLAVSLIVFTLLLKATTLFINIPPDAIAYGSGGLIILIGIFTLFPELYEKILVRLGIQTGSQRLLGKGLTKKGIFGPIITGAALGPVFSSCSPVYAYILATILPQSFGQAFVYIISYVLGLSIMLLLIGYLGQRFIGNLKWASDPKGLFQRSVAVIFIMVGLLVFSGSAIKVQTWVSENTPFDFNGISAKLIPGFGTQQESQEGVLNVKPYDAPEFVGLEDWINSKPLTKEGLKGKVVLIDFWTYSCINCIRTQPYLKGWDDLYRDSGLVIIGMHAPEFAFEKVPANVEKAVKEAGLKYPIALDNDFATWAAYENQYWPAHYLVDAEGMVRRVHFGEGEYKDTEDAIRALLRESGANVPTERFVKGDTGSAAVGKDETPETYLGTRRASNYVGEQRLVRGTHNFTPATELKSNQWTLGGNWEVDSEGIKAGANAVLRFKFTAKDVYFVTAQGSGGSVGVSLDSKPISQTASAGSDVRDSSIRVNDAKLYRAVENGSVIRDGVLELRVPDGVALNAFTFGS